MIISGLILTLNANEAQATAALEQVQARPEFLPGERTERWFTVAMEARDDAHCRELHDWLNALPGVDFVDIASVTFEEPEAPASPNREVAYEH